MDFFRQAIIVEGGLAVLAMLIAFYSGLDLWGNSSCDVEMLKLAGLTTLPMLAGYFILLILPFSGLKKVDKIVRDLFWQQMGHLSLWQLALIAALAGFGEELFFRGLLQLGLPAAFGLSAWAAIFITSLVFGAAHAVTPTYFGLAFVISLYLGSLLTLTGNMLVPIAVHAFYDFFVFLFIRFTPNIRQR